MDYHSVSLSNTGYFTIEFLAHWKEIYGKRFLVQTQLVLFDCVKINDLDDIQVQINKKDPEYYSINVLDQRLKEPIFWWEFRKKREHQEWVEIRNFAMSYWWVKIQTSIDLEENNNFFSGRKNSINNFFSSIWRKVKQLCGLQSEMEKEDQFKSYKRDQIHKFLSELSPWYFEQKKKLESLFKKTGNWTNFELKKQQYNEARQEWVKMYLKSLPKDKKYRSLSDQKQKFLIQYLIDFFNQQENLFESRLIHLIKNYLQIVKVDQLPPLRFKLRLNPETIQKQRELKGKKEFTSMSTLQELVSNLSSEQESCDQLEQFVDYQCFRIETLFIAIEWMIYRKATMKTTAAEDLQYIDYKKQLEKECKKLRCMLHTDNLARLQFSFALNESETLSNFRKTFNDCSKMFLSFTSEIFNRIDDLTNKIILAETSSESQESALLNLKEELENKIDTGRPSPREVFKTALLIQKQKIELKENEAMIKEEMRRREAAEAMINQAKNKLHTLNQDIEQSEKKRHQAQEKVRQANIKIFELEKKFKKLKKKSMISVKSISCATLFSSRSSPTSSSNNYLSHSI